jgi:hypothetical protein
MVSVEGRVRSRKIKRLAGSAWLMRRAALCAGTLQRSRRGFGVEKPRTLHPPPGDLDRLVASGIDRQSNAARLQFKNLTISEGLASSNIRSLAEDSQGNVYAARPVA